MAQFRCVSGDSNPFFSLHSMNWKLTEGFFFTSFFQLNFSDHLKIILCPRMSAVTYIDNGRNFRTYKFSTIAQYGCSTDLYQKLRYAHEKLKRLMEKLNWICFSIFRFVWKEETNRYAPSRTNSIFFTNQSNL